MKFSTSVGLSAISLPIFTLSLVACSNPVSGGGVCKVDNDCQAKSCADVKCSAGLCIYTDSDVGSKCTSGANEGVCFANYCQTDSCYIDGKLIKNKAANPSDGCEICSPTKNLFAYSTVEGACITCSSDDQCNGDICADNSCNANVCRIDGAIVQAGVFDPNNGCAVCDPARDKYAFSTFMCNSSNNACTIATCIFDNGCSGDSCCTIAPAWDGKNDPPACVMANGSNGICDVEGNCGAPCKNDAECAAKVDNECQEGFCSGNGICLSRNVNDIACNNGIGMCYEAKCETVCGSGADTQCVAEEYCDTSRNRCAPKLSDLDACTDAGQCLSGKCDLPVVPADAPNMICHKDDCIDDCYPLNANGACALKASSSCLYDINSILATTIEVKINGSIGAIEITGLDVAPLPVTTQEFATLLKNGTIVLRFQIAGISVSTLDGNYVESASQLSKSGDYTASINGDVALIQFYNLYKAASKDVALHVGDKAEVSITVHENSYFFKTGSFSKNIEVK